jgi:hypothetical protein
MRLRSVESRSLRSVSEIGEGRGVADMAIPLDIDPLVPAHLRHRISNQVAA